MPWSRLVSHDEAARRAAGRRHLNAMRRFEADRRRGEVSRLVEERGGPAHGIRTAIAKELGVSRSTISRDIRALYSEQREPPPAPSRPSTIELIGLLEP